jgi:hypothetical protein
MIQTKHIYCRQYMYRDFRRRMGSLKSLRDNYRLFRALLRSNDVHACTCMYLLLSAPMVVCTGQQRA